MIKTAWQLKDRIRLTVGTGERLVPIFVYLSMM